MAGSTQQRSDVGSQASESATSEGKCFVFVRYWPGFTSNFPYERFSGLPEDVVEVELRRALTDELWAQRMEINKQRRKAKQAAIEYARRNYPPFTIQLEPPNRYQTLNIEHCRDQQSERFRKIRQFRKLARYLGWCRELGAKTLLCSSRQWIAGVHALGLADELVNMLAELRLIKDEDQERHMSLNPRYGRVHAHDLTADKQTLVLAEIEQMSSTDPVDLLGFFVKRIITRSDQFIKGRCSEAHDPVRAHRLKLFPKGLEGLDQDIIDLIVRLESERPDKSDIKIAREFYASYTDAETKANKALSRIRHMRLDGKTSLPART